MKRNRRARKTLWAAFRGARCGAVTIELAMLAPILAFMLIGAIDFGSYIYQKMQLQNASRAGAQFAIQKAGNVDDSAGVTAAVNAASDLDTGTAITLATFCGCADGGETAPDSELGCNGACTGGEFPALSIRVTVSNTFSTLFPYPGIPDSLTLTGQTVMQVP